MSVSVSKMTEFEYRIKSLIENREKYSGKKIAIYGIGKNSELVIDKLYDETILCLIDDAHSGQYIYDKKVYKLEDTLFLNVDVIIIAAVCSSAFLVENRIIEFCAKNRIKLLDMYGCDSVDRRYSIMMDEIKYPCLIADDVRNAVLCAEVVCVELDNIVFEKIWTNDGEGCFRKTIISQINHAVEQNKDVFFIRKNMSYENAIEILTKAGITKYKGIIPDTNSDSLQDGGWRNDLGEDFDRDVLFIGCEYNEIAMLAYDYNMKVIFLKPIRKMLRELHSTHIEIETIVDNSSIESTKEILNRFESPYYSDLKAVSLNHKNANFPEKQKKYVVMITGKIPRFDCDAGSKTLFQYIKLFIKHGYKICIIPLDFLKNGYETTFISMGVEILTGVEWKENYSKWILNHAKEIEFAFVSYPDCGIKVFDFLKLCDIKIVYYGVDLHYIRNRREYELTGEIKYKKEAEYYYKIEKDLISSADISFYPSKEEVEEIRNEFGLNASYLTVLFYEERYNYKYLAEERKGLMFIGGYRHRPNVDAVIWFYHEIFPTIWEKHRAVFYIVGSDEPEEIKRIDHPGVIHLGHISDTELERLYKTIRMVVIPLRYGAGVKGKVIDALYRGIPIVSTSVGIEGIPEADVAVAHDDTAKGFCDSISKLYEDNEELEKTSEIYKEIAWKYYSEDAAWKTIQENVTYSHKEK